MGVIRVMTTGWLVVPALAFFCGSCVGQDEHRYGDPQMVHLMRELTFLRDDSKEIQSCLAATREEIA